MNSKTKTYPAVSIAHEILAYLVERPTAQDTLEGIVEWWLLEQEIQRRTAEVKMALADLVENGLVVERKGRDGRIRYSVNRRKITEIHKIISTKSTREE